MLNMLSLYKLLYVITNFLELSYKMKFFLRIIYEKLIRYEYFNAQDHMDLYYLWWKTGLFSVNGKCFDIGNTVIDALKKYETLNRPCAYSIFHKKDTFHPFPYYNF